MRTARPITAFAALTLWGTVGAAELTITVDTSEARSGTLYAAVYGSAETFLKVRKAAGATRRTVDGPRVVARFADLAPGRYAVAVFVDQNGNGELDTNLIGLPLEPYGFSRDARGNMGPPAFADSAVELSRRHRDISITLH